MIMYRADIENRLIDTEGEEERKGGNLWRELH